MKTLSFNVGLLGHVDSGKTSLAKILSNVSSTAAFDRDPQAQERGITLDLGFSSFSSPIPNHLSDSGFDSIQFTLVDCPGHASLIKTIIGGSHIIDLMILVIDSSKGFQTQTSECLIIGEISKKKMIVVLNKIDLLNDKSVEKLIRKVRLTLNSTFFKACPIVTTSVINNNVKDLIEILLKESFIPKRTTEKPFLFAIDHCFPIKGKGIILTGTVLQGKVKINDEIEIPSLSITRKVKSMEIFRKPVEFALQGDRVGICVAQFDPKTLERGLACQVNYVPLIYAAVLEFNKVRYYKSIISSKSMFHVNVGYENVTAEIVLFGYIINNSEKFEEFDVKKEYKYIPEIYETTDIENIKLFALLEFSRPIFVAPNALAIGGKLDAPIHSNTCRLAFYGNIVSSSSMRNYRTDYLPMLKIYKEKQKKGIIDRISNQHELVGKNMFKKETNVNKFVGMKVFLSTGEDGVIESAFGQSGKFKVHIPCGLKETTIAAFRGKKKTEETKLVPVEIFLNHKRFIYDLERKMIQS